MTRLTRWSVVAGAVVAGVLILPRLYYNTLICIPLSERLWSFFFDLLGGAKGGAKPGIASDLELGTVLVVSGILSYGFGRTAVAALSRFRAKPDERES